MQLNLKILAYHFFDQIQNFPVQIFQYCRPIIEIISSSG